MSAPLFIFGMIAFGIIALFLLYDKYRDPK